ncbi:MAG: hypothetical protein RR053_00030 [Evtepia sp.]
MQNSFFNKTLFRKQMTRFWPLWSLYALVAITALPLTLLLNRNEFNPGFAESFAHLDIVQIAVSMGPWIAAFFGLLSAMAVWSYLYNPRSVGMIHALPVRREGLFLSNYLAGICFFLLPHILIFFTTWAAEAAVGCVDLGALFLAFLIQNLLSLFFFSFATLTAFITGSLLALPCLFAIFNGVVLGMVLILGQTFQCFVYGYPDVVSGWMERIAVWGTPMFLLMRKVRVDSTMVESGSAAMVQGIPIVVGLALVGLMMAAVALLLYRKRKLELAGEVVAVSWIRPIFKYCVAICGGIAVGNLFYAMFQVSSIWLMLCLILLWTAVFYFAAQMLLSKSFAVFHKSWKGCVILSVVLSLGMVAMELDVFGYEKDVPLPNEVASIQLENSNGYHGYRNYGDEDVQQSTDPELIAQLIALHQSLADNKSFTETWLKDDVPDSERGHTDAQGVFLQDKGTQYTWIRYNLKNGKSFVRNYRVPISQDLLKDPDSSATRLHTFQNNPKMTPLFSNEFKQDDLLSATIEIITFNADGYGGETHRFTAEQAKRLYAAVKEDISAGRLGKVFLLDDEVALKTQMQNEIGFTAVMPDKTDEKTDYEVRSNDPMAGGMYEIPADERAVRDLYLKLQTTATSTLAVLKEFGFVRGEQLPTLYDVRAHDVSEKNMILQDTPITQTEVQTGTVEAVPVLP